MVPFSFAAASFVRRRRRLLERQGTTCGTQKKKKTMPATRRRSTIELSPTVLDVLPVSLPPLQRQQCSRRQIKILTLNCWGLLFPASKRRKERVEGIGRALMEWPSSASASVSTSSSSLPSSSSPPPDVVCLQEVWCSADARSIASRAALGGHLIHSHHFRNGAFGSGLLTLSAFPVVAASFEAFAAAGDPLAVLQGDGVAGKGVGCLALDLSGSSGAAGTERGRKRKGGRAVRNGGGGGGGGGGGFSNSPSPPEILVVANTHLAAAYRDAHEEPKEAGTRAAATKKMTRSGGASFSSSPRPDSLPFLTPSDANGPIRLAQTLALADAVAGFAAIVKARRVLLCGDLNSPPRSLEAALLRRLSSGFSSAAEAEAEAEAEPPPLGDAWAFLEEREAAARAAASGDLGLEGDGDDGERATPGRDRWGGATANRPHSGVRTATATTAGAGKRPARIDFVWSFSPVSRLLPVSARVALEGPDSVTGRRLSDHAGVEVVFELSDLRAEGRGTVGEAGAGNGRSDGGENGGGRSEEESTDPLAAALPLLETGVQRARASADAAGLASLGCLLAAAALSSAALLRLSSSLSSSSASSSSSSSSSSSLSLSLSLALALSLSFALGSLSALLFALGYGGRHALSSALAASAERARLKLDAERRRR